jgi:predicted MPP superfamily phosphohydrolase
VVRRETIEVLPAGSKPIRVLQIGDIHLAPWQRNKIRFISSLASEEIDLVVNTGDNLGHQNSIQPLLACLSPLLSKPGVFVNGSNDYFAPVLKNPFGYLFGPSNNPSANIPPGDLDTTQMTSAFERAGWHNLNNHSCELELSGNKIRFIGIDDFHIGLSKFEGISKASRFTVALTHAPYIEVLNKFSSLGASLIFAGHTHGGQVRLPFIGALTTNCDLPNRYARGRSDWDFGAGKVILSVVAGLGNSIFAPFRFFCRPEVRIISLTAIG